MQVSALRFKVPFDESDGEGIVFFGNYFRLAHRALEQWLPEQRQIPWEEWFKNPEFGVPLRHVEADYLSPLLPGQEFEIEIQIAEIGSSSVHFNYEFRDLKGKALSQLKTSHVFVSRKDGRKIELPPNIRDRLTGTIA